MKRPITVGFPQPAAFFISAALLLAALLALKAYLEENPVPVSGNGAHQNATLGDLAEQIFEDLN